MRGLDELHALLSAEGRTLKNIKFFPGSNRGLSNEQLAQEAHDMLKKALEREIDEPPVSGLDVMDLEQALTQ